MQTVYSTYSIYFKHILLVPIFGLLLGPAVNAAERTAVQWLTDYHAGLDQAEHRGLQALLWFYDPTDPEEHVRLNTQVFNQPQIAALIADHFVAIKLPRDAKVTSGGEEITLLSHSAFEEMHASPGLAIVDVADPDGPLYRQTVSIYPFTHGPISAEKLAVLLVLPRGTLTQRTLIFAVRTHAESPASTSGEFSPILAHETESHSRHQARITLQGHHNWDARFHSINAQLPGGLLAREVCAESWPGQNLLDAANECVHSWRQSPGHWRAVSSRQPLFGYDMHRGANGVWYATGIFAGPAD
jgi:hypothetical protein